MATDVFCEDFDPLRWREQQEKKSLPAHADLGAIIEADYQKKRALDEV